MKKILLLAICFGSVLFASAQFTEQGQKVLSANFDFQNSSNNSSVLPQNKNDATGFALGLSVGKFVKKNVLSTFSFSYGNTVSKEISPTNSKNNNVNNYGIAYGRAYYKEIAKKLYFGIGGTIGATYAHTRYTESATTDMSKSESYNINLSISPGISYQLTDRFLISLAANSSFLGINYAYNKTKYIQGNQTVSTGTSNAFSFNGGFHGSLLGNFGFGFSYLLKRK